MNPGGGSKGGYGEPQPAGYGQPITPPPAYGQPAPSYGQPDTMPISSQPQHTAVTIVQAPQVNTYITNTALAKIFAKTKLFLNSLASIRWTPFVPTARRMFAPQ